MKKILAINPWIYDFAAYDLWLKPLGFLQILSLLKEHGFSIKFIDCLDRRHPALKNPGSNRYYGTGKFPTEEIPKPEVLNWVPRRYRRYGIPLDLFETLLGKDEPDFILVSSSMTYWYPAVFDVISVLKKNYKNTPVVLGGVYATLCSGHARERSGADFVIPNENLEYLRTILHEDIDLSWQNLLRQNPAYEFYDNLSYVALRISYGCPFHCAYCAQDKLNPDFIIKELALVLAELEDYTARGVRNFAFYDDALLYDRSYITEFLSQVTSLKPAGNFHTPNGLHARFINQEIASLMRKTSFVNPRLSLETIEETKQNSWHNKVTFEEIKAAIAYLREAGYKQGEISVYLMIGVPEEDLLVVEEAVRSVHKLGARAILAEYSPIPGTKLWNKFPIDIDEPLLQNNSILPYYQLSDWQKIENLKNLAHRLNQSF